MAYSAPKWRRSLKAWIQLGWDSEQRIHTVVICDRENSSDHAIGETLSFSDGSSLAVTAISKDAVPKTISFPPKTVIWLRFQVTESARFNIGLHELQAHRPEAGKGFEEE